MASKRKTTRDDGEECLPQSHYGTSVMAPGSRLDLGEIPTSQLRVFSIPLLANHPRIATVGLSVPSWLACRLGMPAFRFPACWGSICLFHRPTHGRVGRCPTRFQGPGPARNGMRHKTHHSRNAPVAVAVATSPSSCLPACVPGLLSVFCRVWASSPYQCGHGSFEGQRQRQQRRQEAPPTCLGAIPDAPIYGYPRMN